MLGNSSLWNDFRENFRTRGTKSLFMIPFYSDITEEDVERTDEIVKFYVGSYDNLTEGNQHRIIDIFTDSGLSFYLIFYSEIQTKILINYSKNYLLLTWKSFGKNTEKRGKFYLDLKGTTVTIKVGNKILFVTGSNYGIYSMINGLISHGAKVYSYDLTYEGPCSISPKSFLS